MNAEIYLMTIGIVYIYLPQAGFIQCVLNFNYMLIYLQLQLLKSNALDLNGDTLRQLSNSHTAASGLMSEELLISSIHLGEVGHISQEDLQEAPH